MLERLISTVMITILLTIIVITSLRVIKQEIINCELIINSSISINNHHLTSIKTCLPALINNEPVRVCD